jgi:hypothetical protein
MKLTNWALKCYLECCVGLMAVQDEHTFLDLLQ